MKRAVFIQTNRKQLLGAKISAYSYKRHSRRPDSFNVHIMHAEDYPRLMKQGQSILRAGHIRAWDPDDLQSFTPTRFAPPKLMDYEGRAVVTDPDCFGVGDVADLLDLDMAGKAVMAVARPGHNNRNDYVATSVMLLDCAKLTDWDPERDQDDLFAHRFDYIDWIELKRQPADTVGLLDPRWNDFDRLETDTKILHTTKRRTQPWKTGLKVDYTLRERGPFDFVRRWRRRHYEQHPDTNQEALVYALLGEMLDQGLVSDAELQREMAANHIRHDSLEVIERHRGWKREAAA
jgi:hypothetical protein